MWFLCQRAYTRPAGERKVALDEHLVWMREQHEAGNILISGPSADRQRGIYLIRAVSRAAAEQLAASDPFTVAGDATYDLIEWHIHQILGIGAFTADGLNAGS